MSLFEKILPAFDEWNEITFAVAVLVLIFELVVRVIARGRFHFALSNVAEKLNGHEEQGSGEKKKKYNPHPNMLNVLDDFAEQLRKYRNESDKEIRSARKECDQEIRELRKHMDGQFRDLRREISGRSP